MDYKRRLGHRVLPRAAFLALLKQHRGAFRPAKSGVNGGSVGGGGSFSGFRGNGGGNGDSAVVGVGAEVELHGLVSRQDLNGRRGLVEGAADGATGRYPVRLLPIATEASGGGGGGNGGNGGGGAVMGLKAANFTVVATAADAALSPPPGSSGVGAGAGSDSFEPFADGDEADILALLCRLLHQP
jgi:hypothetical protein